MEGRRAFSELTGHQGGGDFVSFFKAKKDLPVISNQSAAVEQD